MAFTNNRVDFFDDMSYNEETFSAAFSKGIPNHVKKGLTLTGSSISNGFFVNSGCFGRLGADGETHSITANYTGFIVIKTTLDSDLSFSEIIESTTRQDSEPDDISNIRYYTIYELENGEIKKDYRNAYQINIGDGGGGGTGGSGIVTAESLGYNDGDYSAYTSTRNDFDKIIFLETQRLKSGNTGVLQIIYRLNNMPNLKTALTNVNCTCDYFILTIDLEAVGGFNDGVITLSNSSRKKTGDLYAKVSTSLVETSIVEGDVVNWSGSGLKDILNGRSGGVISELSGCNLDLYKLGYTFINFIELSGMEYKAFHNISPMPEKETVVTTDGFGEIYYALNFSINASTGSTYDLSAGINESGGFSPILNPAGSYQDVTLSSFGDIY